MAIKLEKIIGLPEVYHDICVNKSGIVGSKYWDDHDYAFDLLAHDGKRKKEFGRNIAKEYSEKCLYKDLNPVKGPSAQIPLFEIAGWIVSLLPQTVLNTVAYVPDRMLMDKMIESKEHVGYPLNIACSENRIFALNTESYCPPNIIGYDHIETMDIAMFDNNGKGISKASSLGDRDGQINLNYPGNYTAMEVFDENLYVLDFVNGVQMRVQEFDLESNHKKTIMQSGESLWPSTYSDFAVNDSGFYLAVRGEEGDWNHVCKMKWDGESEIIDLSSEFGLINGLAASNDKIYVMDWDKICEYSPAMEKISELSNLRKIIESQEDSFSSEHSKLKHNDGRLFFTAGRNLYRMQVD